MIQRPSIQHLALIGFATAGMTLTGCSAFQSESTAAEPAFETEFETQTVEYTGLVAYDTTSAQAFSLVSADQIGLAVFGDMIVAQSLPEPYETETGVIANVE